MQNLLLKILTLTFSLALCLGAISACGDVDEQVEEHVCTVFEEGICRECDPNANTGFIYSKIWGKPKELIGYELQSLGDCYEKDIIIPSKYKGLPILRISDNFASHHGELKSVYFEENSKLTYLGERAFFDCENLRSIDIPVTVTSIGDSAFEYCKSLVYIVIPNSVTTIGNHAFRFCSSLKNMEIPNGVSTISYNLFFGCDSLESVVLPSSVTSVNDFAFGDCAKLTNITVHPNNSSYKTIDGNLYTIDGKTLIQYLIAKTEKSFKIPDTVTSISNYAFYNCKTLESIEIPSGVTSIGHSAFYNCEKLESIVIPQSVEFMGYGVFQECDLITVYCEAISQPSDWNCDWSYKNAPFVWGYKAN